MNAYESIADVHPLMTAIGRGLPIALLVDLVDPNGPRSAEMFEREGITSDDEERGASRRSARTA
ncbi:MAG: hypothetical protein ACRDV3_17855 [Acidothermaceae bacterium]